MWNFMTFNVNYLTRFTVKIHITNLWTTSMTFDVFWQLIKTFNVVVMCARLTDEHNLKP